jgi:hypothetical protein
MRLGSVKEDRMKTSCRNLLLTAGLSFSLGIGAHPVFFADGFGLNVFSAPEKTEAYAAYTLTHRFALGGRYVGFRTDQAMQNPQETYVLAQASFLLKRWNENAAQGNIYLEAAGGSASFSHEGEGTGYRPAAMYAIEADWENRRLYTLGKLSYLKASEHTSRSSALLRAGFAPYLADFNELNSWIIFEAETQLKAGSTSTLTPFVRLFYKNVLVELGYGLDGGFRFNFMTHL